MELYLKIFTFFALIISVKKAIKKRTVSLDFTIGKQPAYYTESAGISGIRISTWVPFFASLLMVTPNRSPKRSLIR